jgi:hypothetical protein
MAEAIATAVDEVALTRAEEETAAEAATALVVAAAGARTQRHTR